MGKLRWWDPRQYLSLDATLPVEALAFQPWVSRWSSQGPTGNTYQSCSCWVALCLSFLSGFGLPGSDWTLRGYYVFKMATWAVCCLGLLEQCLALWRECKDRGPILWKPGKPAHGETPLHHSLTELPKTKLSSPRQFLTIIIVGVGSGKFNKLF